MIAEIVSVGTELLLGDIVDTNAAYLARILSSLGISAYFRSTVGDNVERLRQTLTMALSRSDVVLTVGGLGPTQDDLTKEVAAKVMGISLVEDKAHLRWLQEKIKQQPNVPDSFWKQAQAPQGGRGLPNPTGTALGALFEKDGKIVICLPGPPNELIPMTEQSVAPFLSQRTSGRPSVIQSRTLRIVGMGESRVEALVRDWMDADNPSLAPYAKTGEVHLRLTARASSPQEALAMIEPIENAVRQRLGAVVYGTDDETLESVIIGLLKMLGQTLSAAESCSGGLISKRLTDVPDASQVFGLGLVTYSNEAKTQFLGVPPELIVKVGAVSPEVAQSMAEGARQAGGADIGVSVTGIAGPGGGSEAKPVGTVHVGLAWDGGVISEQHHFLGNRQDISYRSSQIALAVVRRFLMNPDDPQFRREPGP